MSTHPVVLAASVGVFAAEFGGWALGLAIGAAVGFTVCLIMIFRRMGEYEKTAQNLTDKVGTLDETVNQMKDKITQRK